MSSILPEDRRGARPARMAKSERTRGRILDSARLLFNEQGTAAVSTNLMAAEAEVSPGNLYYHFAHKREIIRALQPQIVARNADRWEPSGDAKENLAKLRENLLAAMAV